MSVCTVFEFLRWIAAGTGIFLAYLIQGSPQDQIDILTLLVTVPIAGFTGIESVFLLRQYDSHTASTEARRQALQVQIVLSFQGRPMLKSSLQQILQRHRSSHSSLYQGTDCQSA